MSQEQNFLVLLGALTRGFQSICAYTILLLAGVEYRLAVGFLLALLCLMPAVRPITEREKISTHLGDRAVEVSLASGLVLLVYSLSRWS